MSKDIHTDCDSANFTRIHEFVDCVREVVGTSMLSPTQASVFTMIYCCISLLGALGNGLVIYVVVRRPGMRTTRNVFIVNLAISNFLLALILVPFLWLPTYIKEFPYGSFMCKMAQAFPSTNVFCSTLTVSVIAVDRYYVVVRSRLGPGRMKTAQAVFIALAVWIFSFALSVLYYLHFRTKAYTLPAQYLPEHLQVQAGDIGQYVLFQSCELQPQSCAEMAGYPNSPDSIACKKFYEAALSAVNAVFIYFVPMPILVTFTCMLSRFLQYTHRQHSSLRHRVCLPLAAAADGSLATGDGNTLGLALMNAANSVIGRRNRDQRSHPDAISQQNSSTRRRSRTTSLLFAMAFTNAILWLPFVIVEMVIQLAPDDVTRPYHGELKITDEIAKLISMLSICVNPFLYGYLNTNFNREFKLIFAECCPSLRRGLYAGDNSRAASTVMLSFRNSQPRSCFVQQTSKPAAAMEMDSNSASILGDQKMINKSIWHKTSDLNDL